METSVIKAWLRDGSTPEQCKNFLPPAHYGLIAEAVAELENPTQAAIAVPDLKPEEPRTTQPEMEPGPLTEKLAMQVVQRLVGEDAEYELPERRTFEEIVETLQADGEYLTTKLSVSQLEEIVRKYAPNAPHRTLGQTIITLSESEPNSYPAELESLVKSGVATFEPTATGHWLLNRCDKCGQFKNECCSRIDFVTAVTGDEKTLAAFRR